MTIDTTTPRLKYDVRNYLPCGLLATARQAISSRKFKNSIVFKGTIEIMQVANGFVINVATKEGYEYDSYVASTIQEVNERLAATIVSFKLEQP
jgi:hypothetical protein